MDGGNFIQVELLSPQNELARVSVNIDMNVEWHGSLFLGQTEQILAGLADLLVVIGRAERIEGANPSAPFMWAKDQHINGLHRTTLQDRIRRVS